MTHIIRTVVKNLIRLAILWLVDALSLAGAVVDHVGLYLRGGRWIPRAG